MKINETSLMYTVAGDHVVARLVGIPTVIVKGRSLAEVEEKAIRQALKVLRKRIRSLKGERPLNLVRLSNSEWLSSI